MRLILNLPVVCLLVFTSVAVRANPTAGEIDGYMHRASDAAILYQGVSKPPLTDNLESIYLQQTSNARDKEWMNKRPVTEQSTVESFSDGELVYDRVFYPSVKIRLDLGRDVLEVLTLEKHECVMLDPMFVESARIYGYDILYNETDTGLPKGYYVRLNSGENGILQKESYLFDESYKMFVEREIRYYVEKEGLYYPVRNKKDVFKLLEPYGDELKQFAKSNNLDFRHEMAGALVEIVNEYEKLNK